MAFVCLTLQWFSSCSPDEDKNSARITFSWYGTEDLLKFTHPIVTWCNYPQNVDGETITTTKWTKSLEYEVFDSIIVYAIVTYPRIEQMPDTTGKVFQLGNTLTGQVTANGDNRQIPQTAASGLDSYTILRGGEMKHYLDSLNGVMDQKGFVIYRDGRVRDKVKYEELNWKK